MKENKKMLTAAVVCCLLPLILSAAVYEDLPEKIAIHWDSFGNPDGYASKFAGAVFLPVLMAALELICAAGVLHDPKRAGQSGAARLIGLWTIPVLSLVLHPVTLFIALGKDLNITFIVSLLVGLVMILAGNWLPKSRQNYTIGIKLPWTLDDPDNWNRTHRLGGILYVLAGFMIIAGNFIPVNGMAKTVLTLVSVAVAAVVPVLYSFLLYVRRDRR